jgi:midasin
MSIMLHNTVANARLFATRISESLQQQRSAIDKSIKDFVKLASWKDVNVYALKASAIKSHRQLHRSVRKFKEVLQKPVSPILADLVSVVPQDGTQTSSVGDVGGISAGPLSIEAISRRIAAQITIPQHLIKLDDTLLRYRQILDRHSEPAKSANQAGPILEDMAIEIIETAASLAKETPASLTKDNKKVIANLASRKRKSYADLLKTLRASGFSSNVRADQLARQQSSNWLTSREPLVQAGDENVGKIETYRHRLAVLMGALRRAFNGHHDDIASGDLERGIGFTESLYATALIERDK